MIAGTSIDPENRVPKLTVPPPLQDCSEYLSDWNSGPACTLLLGSSLGPKETTKHCTWLFLGYPIDSELIRGSVCAIPLQLEGTGACDPFFCAQWGS